jgi:16S rRNA processing protein RimM
MDLTEIGYFRKTHGIKGHLILKTDFNFDLENLNAFFIETDGSKAPYFISEISENEKGLIVFLETIDAINKTKPLIGKKVFVDSKYIIEQTEEIDWTGYELIDKNFGRLGKITEVNDNGVQLLVSIIYKDKEVILPLVEDFIESIDEEKKEIHFNAPEGLIDLYLE